MQYLSPTAAREISGHIRQGVRNAVSISYSSAKPHLLQKSGRTLIQRKNRGSWWARGINLGISNHGQPDYSASVP
jgi:hypothetical protein